MNLKLRIAQITQLQGELETSGYERNEALSIIQTAAITRLADCIDENHNGQSIIRIYGSVATYEQ